MSANCELLLLNTAVTDIRGPDFTFASDLAGPGGLAKCLESEMPAFSDHAYRRWIESGHVTVGGPGNTAPLVAHAGLRVAAGAYIGAGKEPGETDVAGAFIIKVLADNGVDVEALRPCKGHATGQSFIHLVGNGERGGLAYFPNANHAFDFAVFEKDVARLCPSVVYYMYSGLSDRGDANHGQDLANFMRMCRSRGSVTIADSHTLCRDPEAAIAAGRGIAEYHLLEPLLPALDLFFVSSDEARLIQATLSHPVQEAPEVAIPAFLDWVLQRYATGTRTRLFGVTVRDGAYVAGIGAAGRWGPVRIHSRYRLQGGIVDLVGAGDSFRAGVVSYVCRHLEAFKNGTFSFENAVQMGNLMAVLYITAPLSDRYSRIPSFETLLALVQSGEAFATLESLYAALGYTPAISLCHVQACCTS